MPLLADILGSPTTELLPSTSVVFLFFIFTGYRYLSVTFYLAWPTPSGPSHCIHHPSSSTQLFPKFSSSHREREGKKKSTPVTDKTCLPRYLPNLNILPAHPLIFSLYFRCLFHLYTIHNSPKYTSNAGDLGKDHFTYTSSS